MPHGDRWRHKAELMSHAREEEKPWPINQKREVGDSWRRGSGDEFDVSQLTDKNKSLFIFKEENLTQRV